MALPLYLAMTAAEIAALPMPENMAYMACHFSSYGLGLSDLPQALAPGAMLVLNDRTPLWDHDPRLVAAQLTQAVSRFGCESVLLDLQRPPDDASAAMVKAIVEALPCPVGVSQAHAGTLPCAVFIDAPAPNRPLQETIAAYGHRPLWLEAALQTIQVTVTEAGSETITVPYTPPSPSWHRHSRLCCSYEIRTEGDRAGFTISRSGPDLQALLEQAQALGISRAVGLYQQLYKKIPQT